jgi:hypothetical protein
MSTMTTGKESRSRAEPGFVSMCWTSDTRHTVPLGTSSEEFRRTRIIYVCYWMIHNSKPSRYVTGTGRPFASVCLNAACGQVLEKITTVVNINEEKYHSNTPVLGWCACICCRRCVTNMPVQDGGRWRACPGCEEKKGHQEGYLMYPLTAEGQAYNIQLGKVLQKERRRRMMGAAGDESLR